ncbi:hypothetical protein [Streptomyces sp. NPDC001068]|uniref:hypothetical protein n=1 Tax=Streptomyces sp. NPDC001068 TaxID=3364544 RepID=UPI0036C8114E
MKNDRRRRAVHGDWHAAVLRNLFNWMLGQLYRCLQERTPFDGLVAFPNPNPSLEAEKAAA